MRVTKVGDQLTVPLPDGVVKELGLKEGDEVRIRVSGPREIEIGTDRRMSREEVLERIRALNWRFPPDFKFNREEANER